jgi:hypothetical protein
MARTWSEEAGALRGGSAIWLSNCATSRRLIVHRPVVPVGPELGVDPVDVLLPGLFLLLAVPFDGLGGQILEQHDWSGVLRLRWSSPRGPDAIKPSMVLVVCG